MTSWRDHIGKTEYKHTICLREDLAADALALKDAGEPVPQQMLDILKECTVDLVLSPLDADTDYRLQSEFQTLLGAAEAAPDALNGLTDFSRRAIAAAFVKLEQNGEPVECDSDDLAMILDAVSAAQLDRLSQGLLSSWRRAVDPKALHELTASKSKRRSGQGSRRRTSPAPPPSGNTAPAG